MDFVSGKGESASVSGRVLPFRIHTKGSLATASELYQRTKVVESANASSASFEIVSNKTNNTSELVISIKQAMEEQSEGSKQILEALTTMNDTSNDVQTSSAQIENGTKEILDAISSLKQSSENMSSNFARIVTTTEATKHTTGLLNNLTQEMTSAVNNISEKIDEFKV